MSKTRRDNAERKKIRSDKLEQMKLAQSEFHRKKDPEESSQLYEPENVKFITERDQRIEAKKANRWTVMCKSCGARITRQPAWLERRLKIFKFGKDTSAMLDYSPVSPQSDMEKMFPKCGNCLGTHWKKVPYTERKEDRQMRSVLLQGDLFHAIPINTMMKGKKLFKSEKNI